MSLLTSTRLPSNLRPTTRDCVHLVTRGHFRSRYKDGGHTIQSAVAENPMLHANFMVLCLIEMELLPVEFLHSGNRDFRPVCSCDLDLGPMTSICELDPYSLKMYRKCEINFLRQKLGLGLSSR